MAELIEALDQSGQPTGQLKTKLQVFDDGDWRKVVHIWLVNSHGKLLAQRRAVKGIFDDLWDVSIGGGIAAGEKPAQAGIRELAEELGVKAEKSDLADLGRWKVPKLIPERKQTAYEFSYTYLLLKDVEISELTLQTAEVAEVRWLDLSDLSTEIRDDRLYGAWVPHPREYYLGVMAMIKDKFIT